MAIKKKAVFKVLVNGDEFLFTQDEVDAADYLQLPGTGFHLLANNRSVNAELLAADETAKNVALQIGAERFSVEIKDELDQMLDTMGYNTDSAKRVKEVKAPMPGLVLDVYVSEGQSVAEGDKLLVLVAMKMENSILAHTAGVVGRVAVKPNEAVEKGQLLVEFAKD